VDHHVHRITRLGTQVLINGIWYKRGAASGILPSVRCVQLAAGSAAVLDLIHSP
jgi:hypothetical protein